MFKHQPSINILNNDIRIGHCYEWDQNKMKTAKKKNKGQKIKHIDMPKPNHVSNENPNIFKILMDDKDKGPN